MDDGTAAARGVASGLSSEIKVLGMCEEFAQQFTTQLQARGISGVKIRMEVGHNVTIWSDTYGAVGFPGRAHEAVQVGDTIFDNLRPSGIPASEFFEDLGGSALDVQIKANMLRIKKTNF